MSQFDQPVSVPNPYDQSYQEPPKTSGLAIASLVCSLILCCPLTTLLGPLLGVIALATIGSNPARKGKGLAFAGIVLGLVFSVGWGLIGYQASQIFPQTMELINQGPNNALLTGTSGDVAGFKDAFFIVGTQPTDEEAQAFLDELNTRYGTFLGADGDQSGRSPAFGQGAFQLTYSLRFDSGAVSSDVEIVFTDPVNAPGEIVNKIGSITIIDPDLGNLQYPPMGSTPDSPVVEDPPDAPEETEAGDDSGSDAP